MSYSIDPSYVMKGRICGICGEISHEQIYFSTRTKSSISSKPLPGWNSTFSFSFTIRYEAYVGGTVFDWKNTARKNIQKLEDEKGESLCKQLYV